MIGTYAFTVTWNPGSTTAYDTLPSAVVRCSITRGRASDLDEVQAGRCTLTLADNDRVYDPSNAASPLVSPGHLRYMRKLQFTIDAVPVYTGHLTRLWAEPGATEKRSNFEFVDGFWILEKTYPVVTPTGLVTTGGALNAVLTASGVVAGDMDLNAGGWVLDARSDGSRTALDLCQEIAKTDMGVFFMSAAGKYTYRGRETLWGRGRAGTVTTLAVDAVGNQVPGFDVARVVNQQAAQAQSFAVDAEGRLGTIPLGVAQTVADTSYLGYPQAGSEFATPFLRDEAQAYAWASHIVTTRKQGDVPTRDVTLPGMTSGQVAQQRDIEIGSSVATTGFSTSSEALVESIRHEISRSQHTTAYTVTPRPGYAFTVGYSTVGGTDLVRYG